MPPEIGWPAIIVLVALWFLYRIERKPTYLPPPSKDVQRELDTGWWT